MCASCDWESALEEIDGAMGSIDELPERAEDFADSVQDKLSDMHTWIEDNKHVTSGQWGAIENMIAGIGRWMP